MKRKFAFLSLLFGMSASACSIGISPSSSQGTLPDSGKSDSTSNPSGNSSSSGTIPDPTITFEDLFDYHNKIQIDLHMDTSEWQKIQTDYIDYSSRGLKSPIYRYAKSVDITVEKNGVETVFRYDHIGVRMKGNTSRRDFIDENGDIFANIHLKLSFEETFDNPLYYTEAERMTWTPEEKLAQQNREFFGMSKIDLRFNKNADRSWIREYYALEMFRSFGILSQHSNFSQLNIHTEKGEMAYGLYLLTEPLNKSFIKRSLSSSQTYINMRPWAEEKVGTVGVAGSKYGQFYKASYGLGSGGGRADLTSTESRLFGVEPEDASYLPVYELKSNTQNGEDHTLIKNMITKLNNGTLDDIKQVVDLDYFAMYEAISTILGDPDDLRNNYNNYAMYFRRTDGKMVIIPIDQDRVLGISRDYDPSGNAMSLISPYDERAVGANENQCNPLFTKTILQKNDVRTAYEKALQTVLASKWMTTEHFNVIYEVVKANYEAYTRTTLSPLDWTLEEEYRGAKQNMSFATYIETKKKTINGGGDEPGPIIPDPNIIKDYDDFYYRGTYNGWDAPSEKTKFTTKDQNTYTFYIEMTSTHMEFKVFIPSADKWLSVDQNGGVLKDGPNIIVDIDESEVGYLLQIDIHKSDGTLTWELIFAQYTDIEA